MVSFAAFRKASTPSLENCGSISIEVSAFLETSFLPESNKTGFNKNTAKTANKMAATTIFVLLLLSATARRFPAIYFGWENIKNILQFYYYIKKYEATHLFTHSI
jgi:hypothetical protein